MSDNSRCPRCNGARTSAAFISLADGSSRYAPALPCSLCKGVGTVGAQAAAWFYVGRAHYEARVARMESVRECAKRLSVSPSELSAMEHGRADPARLPTTSHEGDG